MSVRIPTVATGLYATCAALLTGLVAYALLELAAWWWLSQPREDYHVWRFIR